MTRVLCEPSTPSPLRLRVRRIVLISVFASAPLAAAAQTFQATTLTQRSTGAPIQNFWRLEENGYVGAYFTVNDGVPVTVRANVAGSTNDGVAPRLNFAVADAKAGFDVAAGFANYEHTFDLPAGTYFLRAEFANDSPTAARNVTFNNLTFEGAGSVTNSSSRSVNEARALAAADTYIEHFRQGPSTVVLAGAAPGSSVSVRMRRNEFNFGTYVTGFSANPWVGNLSPGETTTNRARYQDFVTQYFNMLVPSNMGKWQPTENTQGVPTMSNVDAILNFAEENNMSARQHNLAWGAQQPGWVNSLITDALSSDPTVAAQAKADLRQAVINRIRYYVGDGDADQNDGDRARRYEELDVVNEILREKTYYNIFGNEGIAEIYKLTKDAVAAAGADTLLMTNEYNIFNFAGDPFTGATDNYANWYREHVEELNSTAYGKVVDGIGIQYIVNPVSNSNPTAGQNHNAGRINQVLQNMAITELPVTLTEFSIPAEAFGEVTSPERAAQIYDETLRMMYGSPLGRSMLIWEPWPTNPTDQTSLVDANWNLTPAGEAYTARIDEWRTADQLLTVGPDGAVEIDGFYGEYEVIVNGETFVIDHAKSTPVQTLVTGSLMAGDFNGNGVVDAADYTLWRDAVGTETRLLNDPVGGVIGDAQYQQWANNYGASRARSTSVPEPAAALCALALAAFGKPPRSVKLPSLR